MSSFVAVFDSLLRLLTPQTLDFPVIDGPSPDAQKMDNLAIAIPTILFGNRIRAKRSSSSSLFGWERRLNRFPDHLPNSPLPPPAPGLNE